MKVSWRRLLLGSVVALTSTNTVSGDLRPEGPTGYVVKGGSATYAGSPLPADDTRGSLEPLYFGQYIVRALGARGGFSSDVGSDSRIRPKGAVIALWAAMEVGDQWANTDRPLYAYQERINRRYYYTAALPTQLIPYPSKSPGHRYYGIYVSAGKTVVSDKGLRPEDAPQATAFTVGRANVQRYVFGREDTIYYKILSQGPTPVHVEDDPSPWHTLSGVALSEAQYMELWSCSPDTLTDLNGKPCRAFLSLDDPDLTPEQREYVRRHAITRRDIKPLIKDLKRAARIHDRWL
jgi:hypothetical protein